MRTVRMSVLAVATGVAIEVNLYVSAESCWSDSRLIFASAELTGLLVRVEESGIRVIVVASFEVNDLAYVVVALLLHHSYRMPAVLL